VDVGPGECVGLVGESGAGKSLTGLAAMSLLPSPGFLAAGSIRIGGREVAGMSERQLAAIRGSEIGMIFQDPLVALSPVHTIGRHLTEAVRRHSPSLSRAATRARAVELLDAVGVTKPGSRLGDYPHQFSGGMAQRVVIALALAGEPRVLVADEPTTALDVTTQRQVLDLLCDLKDRLGMGVLLITHDFGVVADACDRAAVMYAGQIVEHGTVEDLFQHPRHPYTSALLAAMPATVEGQARLQTINGRVPLATEYPPGCRFAPRCPHVTERCAEPIEPIALGDLHGVRCVRNAELTLTGVGGPR
jgi:peptide/nickel transport system permease protein